MHLQRVWHPRCSFLVFPVHSITRKERCGTDIGGNRLELSNVVSGGAEAVLDRRVGTLQRIASSLARELRELDDRSAQDMLTVAVQKLIQLDKSDLIETGPELTARKNEKE